MNIKKIFIVAMIALMPSLAVSFEGPPGCGKDCSTCHTLTDDEAAKILKVDSAKVSESSAKGLWQVDGIQNNKPFRVYIDYSKKNLLLINRIIPVDSIGKPPKSRVLDVKKIPLTGTILMGSPEAKSKIIVFDDPDCPYCRKLHKEIKKVIAERKDIAFYIKLYPLPMHPEAYNKSRSILCKNSLEYLDLAFEGKAVPEVKCDTQAVDQNIALAKELDINGTPGIILPDGRLIPGYIKAEQLLELIDSKEEKK